MPPPSPYTPNSGQAVESDTEIKALNVQGLVSCPVLGGKVAFRVLVYTPTLINLSVLQVMLHVKGIHQFLRENVKTMYGCEYKLQVTSIVWIKIILNFVHETSCIESNKMI